MADFCKQCSIELFGKDSKDLARPDAEHPDSKFPALCENCGWIVIDKDGKCLHLGEHRESLIQFITSGIKQEEYNNIMRMKVHSRDEVEGNGVALEEDYVMISISCPNDPAKIPDRENCKEILRLEFDDIDASKSLMGDLKCKLFSQEDAQNILAFFNRYKDVYKYMIIHCDAGISRSPAVAAALTKIQDKTDFDFFTRYHPNRRVYSMLLAEFYNTEE